MVTDRTFLWYNNLRALFVFASFIGVWRWKGFLNSGPGLLWKCHNPGKKEEMLFHLREFCATFAMTHCSYVVRFTASIFSAAPFFNSLINHWIDSVLVQLAFQTHVDSSSSAAASVLVLNSCSLHLLLHCWFIRHPWRNFLLDFRLSQLLHVLVGDSLLII